MERKEILIDKSQYKIFLIVFILFTLVFGTLSYLCIKNGWEIPFLIPWFLPILLVSITIVCVIVIIVILKKKKEDLPALVLDEQGFIDNNGIIKERLIKWSEVEQFKEISTFGIKRIAVMFKDKDAFINSFSGRKKSMLNTLYTQNGTPVIIATKGLDYDFNDLLNELNSRLG